MSCKCSLLLTASLMMGVIVGCGKSVKLPEPVSVSGKITLGGQPLNGATVAFSAIAGGLPPKYRYQATTTDENGRYALDDVYPSEYQVSVHKDAAPPAGISGDMVMASASTSELAEYGEDSPLRAMVSDSASAFDFDLKAAKKRK
ncbi:hypothetical protein GC163_22830 [bacterium]|nr:hypothetical protein [bacterium]